jgi:preprotein translocase subunit YajC
VTCASVPMRHCRRAPVDFSLVSDIVPVLFLVGVFLLFWVAIVRPQSRRRRELMDMQSTLEVGDEVMLTSGVYGTVRSLEDKVAQVEIADGVTIRVARGAVGQLMSENDFEDALDDTAPDAPHDVREVPEEN